MNWITNSVLPKIKAWVQSDDVPENLWVKCTACNQMIFHREFEIANNCCTTCGHHAPLDPEQRFAMTFDDGKFETISLQTVEDDPLKFRDSKKYIDRLRDTRNKTGLNDAIAVAAGTVNGFPCVMAAFNFRFMGGSMGSVVGEKFVRGIEYATEKNIPFVSVAASGGARMQEGLMSLMQMAKTTAALKRLDEKKIPYISILTDPTMGGVSASFAFVADVVIAEPNALIGFAGPRVIEQTVREKLPKGFQRSEFLLEKGAIDLIIDRRDIRKKVGNLLSLLKDSKM